MPSQPYTAAEIDESKALLELINALLDGGDESDEELADDLMPFVCEPLQRCFKQEIGPERWSLERLRREARERGTNSDDRSMNVYLRFGYHLDWLPAVIEALQPPDNFETHGGHYFTGEEGVLLLLQRYRSTEPLIKFTWESGRSIAAISEAVWFMVCAAALACSLLPASSLTSAAALSQVEHIHDTFRHLVDERSFTSWAPHFREFADTFTTKGLPIPNLIGFIDGKLWPICRPGVYQHVLYSGHKRVHGLKTQGIQFPNGECQGASSASLHLAPHCLSLSLTKGARARLIKWPGAHHLSVNVKIYVLNCQTLSTSRCHLLSHPAFCVHQASCHTRSGL